MPLVDLAALHFGVGAENALDRRAQRLQSVNREQLEFASEDAVGQSTLGPNF